MLPPVGARLRSKPSATQCLRIARCAERKATIGAHCSPGGGPGEDASHDACHNAYQESTTGALPARPLRVPPRRLCIRDAAKPCALLPTRMLRA